MALDHWEILFKNADVKTQYSYSNCWLSDFLKWFFSYTTQVIKATSETLYSLSMSILNLEFSIVVFLLVILSGDVSENPGPGNSEASSQLPNALSILHLNIRSIRYKLDYINENFIDFNVLCFTETHLDINVKN